jgi:CRISPR-associated protein Csx17
MRSGKAYLATPLERVNVSDEPPLNLLDELDQRDWLAKFRRYAQGDNTARRFITLRQRLEAAFFEFAGHMPTPGDVQSVLALLGDIQAALSNSSKAVESVPPVPRLSERWVQMADDGTPAFRIARALAGLRGVGDIALPLRSQVFPVHRKFDQWAGTDKEFRVHTGVLGRSPDTLHALLSRRLRLAGQFGMADKPLAGPAGATLHDIAAFLRDDAMDRRITELLPGLVLCDIPLDAEHDAGVAAVPAAFGLLKLCVTPDATLRSLGALGEADKLPVPAGMLAQLVAGNARNRAVESAWRRLHASGLSPQFDFKALPQLGSVDPRRAAAALLIPLRYGATGALMRSVLRTAGTPLEAA